MADRQFSKYQQNIIKNFYDNKETMGLQRLSELVTELYLSEGKKRAKQWEYIVAALEKCGIPKARIEMLQKKDDAALLAKVVEELIAKG
jgi:predicted Mrr-cat superfamily restriction endonuclease